MPRFDVHPMPGRGGRGYVLNVQADLLSQLGTRAVVPLLLQTDAPPPIGDINPVFEIEGEAHVMLTQAIASVPAKELRQAITSLASYRGHVVRALDILLTGL